MLSTKVLPLRFATSEWNQSGPSTQPKILKAEWLKNKRAATGAPAEEQAAKRTNTEIPPGGGGHVASNNGGAEPGWLSNCYSCGFPVVSNAQNPAHELVGGVGKCGRSAGLKYRPLGFYGFVRGMYGVCTGYVRGMYGFGSVVRSVVRTGSTPYQART